MAERSEHLHLTNLLERLKLESHMLSTIRSEWLYWIAFILILVFVALERPNQLFLDLNVLFLNAIGSGVESSDSPSSALQEIIAIQASLADVFQSSFDGLTALSTLQPVAPLLVASLSKTSECTSPFSSSFPALWSKNNILSGFTGFDTLTNWNSSISCIGGSTVSETVNMMGKLCGTSFISYNSSPTVVAYLPTCDTSTILSSWYSSAVTAADVRFVAYTTGGEFMFLAKASYTLHSSGTFWFSTYSYALPSISMSASFLYWISLISISLLVCAVVFALDSHELYLVWTSRKSGSASDRTYKCVFSFFLMTLPVSRIILYYAYMDQFGILAEFYRNRAFTASSAYSLYANLDSVASVYSGFNVYCFIVILLSTLRFLELPQSHPRIAMLSSTVLIGQIQLSNFMIVSATVIIVYGLLGSVLLAASGNPQYMSFVTFGLSEVTLSSILVGVWPFAGTNDSYQGFLLVSFFVIYGIFAMFLLVNVFLVIIVDNFMKFKVEVEEQVVENNFFYDMWLLAELTFRKIGFSSSRWPESDAMAAVLQYIRDKRLGDSEIIDREMFLQYMNWISELTSEDVENLRADMDLQASTLKLISKSVTQARKNENMLPQAAWEWYAAKFASSAEDFLHPEFSLAAHRYGLRCKYIVRDLESVRTVINGNISRSHDVFKELSKSKQRLLQNCQAHTALKSLQAESKAALWHLSISDGKSHQHSTEGDDIYLNKLLKIVQQQNELLRGKIEN